MPLEPGSSRMPRAELSLPRASCTPRDEVTRVEVELAGGGFFVLRDGGRAIAATTRPGATAGLVVYDLRTCLQQIDEPKPKRRRAKPKPKDADGKVEDA